MKKIIVIAVIALLLTGCNEKAPTPSIDPTPEPTPTATATPEPSPGQQYVFEFTRENFPRLDGSTSTQPLAQAIACVMLGEPRDAVADLAIFNKTTQSYRNLMYGECDLVIAAEPDEAVFTEMANRGFRHAITPFAMDALVFMVNSGNPVESLTIDELQRIYTGEITNWNEVGGNDIAIDAFQRNAGSGSQVLMEKLVMQGLTLADAPSGFVSGEMGGLIDALRDFDGSASAIGYTVYYYAEDMRMADGLKLLKIEDVEPNDDTIARGEYAFLNPYFLAMGESEPEDSPTRILFNWILSGEGQALVKSEGYVPINGN